jgi:predicted metal-dependent peptidase
MSSDIDTKLAAARTRLILDKPFLGALVLRLPMVAADPGWCKTTATDARRFYYNPQFIGQLTGEETQFILAHEALHCALSHFARRQHRVKRLWDVACDYAINPLLIKDGLKAPPGSLYEDKFEGMTAEEIYPFLDDNLDEDTLDEHLYDSEQQNEGGQRGEDQQESGGRSPDQHGGEHPPEEQQGDGGASSEPDQQDQQQPHGHQEQDQSQPEHKSDGAPRPPPLSQQEQESLAAQWQQRLAGAAQQALQAGKLGGVLARMVDFMLQPQVPWRMLLARYMSQVARDDYSYIRPSTRRGDPAVYPSLRSGQLDVLVAVDTSGSISDKEIGEFVSELDALKGQIRARITLLTCDAALSEQCPWIFEPWEEVRAPENLQGGGGTRFEPVFDWADAQDRQPDLLVYFTDARGSFPSVVPQYPVIWLVKGKSPVPWGQRVQLN